MSEKASLSDFVRRWVPCWTLRMSRSWIECRPTHFPCCILTFHRPSLTSRAKLWATIAAGRHHSQAQLELRTNHWTRWCRPTRREGILCHSVRAFRWGLSRMTRKSKSVDGEKSWYRLRNEHFTMEERIFVFFSMINLSGCFYLPIAKEGMVVCCTTTHIVSCRFAKMISATE